MREGLLREGSIVRIPSVINTTMIAFIIKPKLIKTFFFLKALGNGQSWYALNDD